MTPIVDLAPGAHANPLAARAANLIRSNLERNPKKVKLFRSLRGAIQVVPFDTGDAFTLRFDNGRLIVHDGPIGIPSVTIGATTETLEKMLERPLRVTAPTTHEAAKAAMRDWLDGDLRVYGMLSHPRMLLRFSRLLTGQRFDK